MSWNYRIVRYKDDSGFGLHEVYYDDEGQPWGMTTKPVSFSCDLDEGVEGIHDSMIRARTDAIKRPVLHEPDVWPGNSK